MASFNLPELLHILSTGIHDRKTLFNLCLVSKAFNEIFSEYYYQELFFCERNGDWLSDNTKFRLLALNRRCLNHVKHFTFCAYADTDLNTVHHVQAASHPSEVCQSLGWWLTVSSHVTILLRHMPRLESFTWVGYPLDVQVTEELQVNCPRLKSLTVVEPQNRNLRQGLEVDLFHLPVRSPDQAQWQFLTQSRARVPALLPFRNLKRLHLHHMWGADLGLWRNMIVQVLINSPGLLDLGLSLSGSTRWRLSNFNLHQNDPARHPAHFLRELCRLYRESGGEPLKLKALHLGHYMFVLRARNSPRRYRPEFADEHENGGHLDALVDRSSVRELTMDLINDGGFPGDIPNALNGYDNVLWWPTAPGPMPKLEKLSVRMPTSWFVRWAKRVTETGAPLRQIRVNEAAFPGSHNYPLYHAHSSNIAVNWTHLLACKPKELMFFRASRNAISFNEATACKSIRYLATDCEPFCKDVNLLASRMPQLEGLYLMSTNSNQHPALFYDESGGDITDIQQEKAEWEAIVRDVANILHGLKFMRINSVTWRIDRELGLALHELDRMENERVIPDLFKIAIPYEFDVAHAAKFWVRNRYRDDDEMM
ncbi:uncharacterized protein F4807DRAFT_465568 [Annulohypoxylon truncatum]|uniref:uncharacterized protein n=1 Tax=Annulohypoxylon truncatum TaxID=327061 RepID=UPI002008A9C1|nr:uncharacterized protein F4807DRAFT_465568 [Annulohypoxylon truncatum]KAI1204541.1 hypothetical protein F4807DRAFT_465568 [Annulohypoxylon truncatum]